MSEIKNEAEYDSSIERLEKLMNALHKLPESIAFNELAEKIGNYENRRYSRFAKSFKVRGLRKGSLR